MVDLWKKMWGLPYIWHQCVFVFLSCCVCLFLPFVFFCLFLSSLATLSIWPIIVSEVIDLWRTMWGLPVICHWCVFVFFFLCLIVFSICMTDDSIWGGRLVEASQLFVILLDGDTSTRWSLSYLREKIANFRIKAFPKISLFFFLYGNCYFARRALRLIDGGG